MELPGAFEPLTGLADETVAMLSAYSEACDIALSAYTSVAARASQMDDLRTLHDALYAQFDAAGDRRRCTETEKCLREFGACLEDAQDDYDQCMEDARNTLDWDLAACQAAYEEDLAGGMNSHLAKIILEGCNTWAHTEFAGRVTWCATVRTADEGVCTAEYLSCLADIVSPY